MQRQLIDISLINLYYTMRYKIIAHILPRGSENSFSEYIKILLAIKGNAPFT